MTKKLLTLEQLYSFCANNHLCSFNSQEFGYKLAVQVPAQISFTESTDKSTEGLLFTTVKVCHIGVNRNHSRISEENMIKAMPSLKHRPLLGYIHQLDSGEYDFHSHDMAMNEDGSLEILETQIGQFTEQEPYLEYDEDYDKIYVKAEAVISEDYSYAADIIRRKNGTKVSCELLIDYMQYDAKDKVLELVDFRFSGVTCLGSETNGTPIEEGMLGSRLDIKDFSESKNSRVQYSSENTKIVEALDRLNQTLSNLNTELIKEGGSAVQNTEVITTNEDVVSFEDVVVDTEPVQDDTVVVEPVDEEVAGEEEPEIQTDEQDQKTEENLETTVQEDMQKVFTISHDDIKYSLYALLVPFEEADNDYYYIHSVYDDYFAYESYHTNLIYGQKYAIADDKVTFEGERYALHKELLTDSEYAKLKDMRANYEALEQQVQNYEAQLAKIETEEKNALLASECYSSISETKEYATLVENIDKYNITELEEKADALLGKYNKQTFASTSSAVSNKKVYVNTEPTKDSPYGGLFKNK